MPLIREKDADALRKLAQGATKEIDVTLYTQRESPLIVPGVVPCESCEAAEQLIDELAAIVPKMNAKVLDLVENRDEAARDGVDRVPTILLGGAVDGRVRFLGFPGGYEFATFVKSLLEVGGAPDGLPDDMRSQLATLDRATDIKVFVTPT